MLRRCDLCLLAVLLSLSVSAVADITMTNGADLDMDGSVGSTIIFPDGTSQSTATVAGAQGDCASRKLIRLCFQASSGSYDRLTAMRISTALRVSSVGYARPVIANAFTLILASGIERDFLTDTIIVTNGANRTIN